MNNFLPICNLYVPKNEKTLKNADIIATVRVINDTRVIGCRIF